MRSQWPPRVIADGHIRLAPCVVMTAKTEQTVSLSERSGTMGFMASEVRNNAAASRYELFVDDELVGVADYAVAGDRVVFPHTEIARARRGKGLGAVLVKGALDDVRPTGRAVVPRCWYVAEFIDDHPEYQELVATTA